MNKPTLVTYAIAGLIAFLFLIAGLVVGLEQAEVGNYDLIIAFAITVTTIFSGIIKLILDKHKDT